MADETDGIAHDYRLVNINKLQQRLEDERDRRNNVSKKYHRGINIVNVIQNVLVVTSIGLNAIGLGLLSTIIAAPAVISIQAVSLGALILIKTGDRVNKNLNVKAEKHEKIKILAETTLDKIINHLSKSLDDEVISEEEFTLVLSEGSKFTELKEEIRTTQTLKNNVKTRVKDSIEK